MTHKHRFRTRGGITKTNVPPNGQACATMATRNERVVVARVLGLVLCTIFVFLGGLTAFGAETVGGGDKRTDNLSLFSAGAYLEHVGYLASNELEGRGTGQPGIDRAAEYIAEVFERYGLEPAGDNGTYFQNFTLQLKYRVGEETELAIGTRGRSNRQRLSPDRDYIPLPFSATGEFAGEVVFAGYGVTNGDSGYDDYAGVEVADKVVLLLRGAPGFAAFSDQDKSFRAKASGADARNAAAIMVVNASADVEADDAGGADELYDFDQGSPGYFGFGREDYGIPMLHVRRAAADRMLKAAGMPGLAELQRRIEKEHEPASARLKGVSVKGAVEIVPEETPVRNVVGMIPGGGPKADEIIILGAHYDHVGVARKGEPDFDPEKDVFNGADDNASGTAMLMTLAKAYTQGERPNRSLLLIAFTGEELGLLGSAHFVREPTVDLGKCIAMINFDMVGRLKDDRLEVGGSRTGGFEEMTQQVAERHGLKLREGGGGAGPSDHAAFYSKGIPVMFLFTGIHRQYHQPTDDTGLINGEGAMRIARFAADCIDEIDAKRGRPEFQSDDRPETLLIQDEESDDGGDAAGPPQRRPRNRVRLGVGIGAEEGAGVEVGEVAKDSPAERAGIKEGDRIVRLGDRSVETARDLFRALRGVRRGDRVTIVVGRKGETLEVEVRFGVAAEEKPSQGAFEKTSEALVGLAKRLQSDWGHDRSDRSISWAQEPDSVVVKVESRNRDEVVAFHDEVSRILKGLSESEASLLVVTYKITLDAPLGKKSEAAVQIERPAKPAAEEVEAPKARRGGDGEKRPESAPKPRKPRRAAWTRAAEQGQLSRLAA